MIRGRFLKLVGGALGALGFAPESFFGDADVPSGWILHAHVHRYDGEYSEWSKFSKPLTPAEVTALGNGGFRVEFPEAVYSPGELGLGGELVEITMTPPGFAGEVDFPMPQGVRFNDFDTVTIRDLRAEISGSGGRFDE